MYLDTFSPSSLIVVVSSPIPMKRTVHHVLPPRCVWWLVDCRVLNNGGRTPWGRILSICTSWHMHLHVTKLYCINNLACWRLYSVQTCKGFITFRSRCVGSRRTLTVIGCHTHRHLCPHYRLGAPYPSMNDRPIVVHRSEWWADMTPPIRPGLIYDGHERCMLRDATVGERSVLHRWWCTIHCTTGAVWFSYPGLVNSVLGETDTTQRFWDPQK